MTRVDPSLMSPTEEMIGEHQPREHAEPLNPHTKSLQLDADSVQSEDKRDGGCWQVRYTFAFLALVGIALMYAMRVVLSIAIVAMVGSNGHQQHANVTHEASNICPDSDALDHGDVNTSTSITKDSVLEGEFAWDETIQGVILGSFFWGYCCTNIMGGRAAEYMGGKLVFGLGIVLSALLTVLTPVSARISTELLIAVRVLGGIVQGVVFPAVNSMLATWIPPTERSMYTTIVFSGFPLGTVVCLPVGGWLCSSGFLDGWPSPFYLFGGLGLLWGVAWFLLIHDRPEHHPRISKQELAHIQSFGTSIKRAEVVSLPVKDIVLSLPFWGLMAGSVGYDFGFYTLLTELPTYLKNIQNFDMSQNGLMSALPFLVMWLWGYVWGSLMDRFTAASLLPLLSIRRLSMAVGMYGPMIGLVLMCFVNCNTVLAMVVLCMAVGISGSVNCGFLCSHQDLAPNFAGTLLGLTNTVGSFAGILAPMITGSITEGNQTLSAWRSVFLITVAVYCVTNTLYIIFISCKVQPWNEPKIDKDGKEYIVDQETRVTMVSDETRETLLEKNIQEC
ncbi:putative inorganic phosphate cotransporter [Procambarus clarkii]|uniref:putative inorganic phosphate cotransporter n=1 Tax=Procambarus clarkii TaxID=6728 RepID=UPI001E671A23|nr:putative inorganic phosphate cotransporter [Procambarus clarkii]